MSIKKTKRPVNYMIVLSGGFPQDRKRVLDEYLYFAIHKNDVGVDPTEIDEKTIRAYYIDKYDIMDLFESFIERRHIPDVSKRDKVFVFDSTHFKLLSSDVTATVKKSDKPFMDYPPELRNPYADEVVEKNNKSVNSDDSEWYDDSPYTGKIEDMSSLDFKEAMSMCY